MKLRLADGNEVAITDDEAHRIAEHYHHHEHEGEKNMERTDNNSNRAPVTGTVGTILGGIGTAGVLAASGMGLFGGGNGGRGGNNLAQENADLRAQVARLTSEKYTDSHVLAMGKQLSAVDAQLHAVDDKFEKMIAQNKADIAANALIADKNLTIAKLESKNDMLAMESRLTAAITTNANSIAALQTVVGGITKVVIPSGAVCDTANGCNCGNQ